MSALVLILRKIVSIIRIVCVPFKWLFNSVCKKRSSNIGELPFHVVTQQTGSAYQLDANRIANTDGNSTTNVWNNWNENSFNVESKIEEYRRKKAEMMQQQGVNNSHHSMRANPTTTTSTNDQIDYFNEMQPKFKAPKKLHLADPNANSSKQRNLFEMREGEVFVPETAVGELGDLDLDSIEWSAATDRLSADRTTSWSEDVDDNELAIDELAREQKRREREEKHKQRLQDHERRMNQKRVGEAQQISRLK